MNLLPASPFQTAVRERLREILSHAPQCQKELEPLLLNEQAKFLRAALTGSLCPATHPAGAIAVAAAAELVHAASLIHDDIIDEAPLRRGIPTLHQRHPIAWAVLAGDFLLSQAVKAVEPHGPSLLSALSRVVEELSLAAMEEWKLRGGVAPSSDRLREIAAGKTGALFGFCLEAGALLENRPLLAGERRRAGVHLGIAFQGIDDLLDLLGPPGKPRAADLRERNPNRLVSLAVERDFLPSGFTEALKKENWEEAAELLLTTRASDLLWREIHADLDAAQRLLQTAADLPELYSFFQLLRKDPRYEYEQLRFPTQKHHHL